MYCPHCKAPIGAAMTACPRCGKSLVSRGPAGASLGDLFKAAIGPNARSHYLSRFKAAQGGSRIGWHWPAFFVTLYWLMYRKMWAKAGLYFLAGVVTNVAITLSSAANPMLGAALTLLALLGFFLVPPMLANGWYYQHCKGLIRKARSHSDQADEQLEELQEKGGTSWIGVIVLAVVALAVTGMCAAIAVPAYQDFTQRTRTAQALAHGTVARTLVTEYHAQHQRLPQSLQEAGFSEPNPPHINRVDYDANSGQIEVQMSEPNGSLVLTPSAGATGQLTWRCAGHKLRPALLPSACKSPETRTQ